MPQAPYAERVEQQAAADAEKWRKQLAVELMASAAFAQRSGSRRSWRRGRVPGDVLRLPAEAQRREFTAGLRQVADAGREQRTLAVELYADAGQLQADAVCLWWPMTVCFRANRVRPAGGNAWVRMRISVVRRREGGLAPDHLGGDRPVGRRAQAGEMVLEDRQGAIGHEFGS